MEQVFNVSLNQIKYNWPLSTNISTWLNTILINWNNTVRFVLTVIIAWKRKKNCSRCQLKTVWHNYWFKSVIASSYGLCFFLSLSNGELGKTHKITVCRKWVKYDGFCSMFDKLCSLNYNQQPQTRCGQTVQFCFFSLFLLFFCIQSIMKFVGSSTTK